MNEMKIALDVCYSQGMKTLDLFAGAGGWDVAGARLGLHIDRAEIWLYAIATAENAGFLTPYRNVAELKLTAGQYELQLGSPPCQTYSMAGKGDGRKNLDRVLLAVHGHHDLSDLDERIGLVLEPLRLALEGRPRLIAWEQVPAVLPIWEACAEVLRENGYSVATGILNAEQYGVPQTRRRAVLVARLDSEARLPVPTHSRFWSRNPGRLDPDVKPWVSMAEALGWGMTERPSMTVCGGGTETGGAEPFGNAARQGIRRELASGRWAFRNNNTAHARVNGASAKGIRVTPGEAACLQTFPPDYPWQGNKGQVFQQIGNAIPPLLAEAILTELIK